jgi:hypothetical protein
MKKKRYTSEQIVAILGKAEKAEESIGEVCWRHGVSEATFYRWRRVYGDMQVTIFRLCGMVLACHCVLKIGFPNRLNLVDKFFVTKIVNGADQAGSLNIRWSVFDPSFELQLVHTSLMGREPRRNSGTTCSPPALSPFSGSASP